MNYLIHLSFLFKLEIDINNVSIKAGTNEHLDALGRNEAVKAEAIVLLKEEK